MTFNSKAGRLFYKTASGDGRITCDNGQKARVRIGPRAAVLHLESPEIVGGTGRFSGARNLDEVLGSYAQSEAHAGAGNRPMRRP